MSGIHWRSPQVLLSAFAVLVALVFAVRSGPPPSEPAPTLTVEEGGARTVPSDEAVLYEVDEDGVAHPTVRELPAPDDPGARLQGIVDALREEMLTTGGWPEALPGPAVHVFTHERATVAVLDVPDHDAELDVARERAIVASLERTLAEAGVERVAYVRAGRAQQAPFGTLALPSGLD